MVGEASAHRRSAAKRFMALAKVVGDNEQGHGMAVVYQLAGEAKAQARKAPVERPDGQIEALNVAGANLVHVRLASNGSQFDAGAAWRAVTANRVKSVPCFQRVEIVFAVHGAVNLLHHGKIETAKQVAANGRDIGLEAVTGDLNHARDAGSQVGNKVVGGLIIPPARQVRDNQLGAAVNAKKGVEVTAQLVGRSGKRLANPNPRPQFVKLDGFGLNLAHGLIVEAFALFANDVQHFQHGILVAPTKPSRCPNAATFRQAAHDLNDFGFVQTQADEPALLVKSLSAVEATKALNITRAGFETAEFLDFSTTA